MKDELVQNMIMLVLIGASTGCGSGLEQAVNLTWNYPSVRVGENHRIIKYLDEGNKGGIPVLLLHGADRCVTGQFQDQIRALAETGRYRVIYPFRAGRGGSDSNAPQTIQKDTDDMIELMDQLGIRSAAVIGHSAGSYVMRDMMVRYGDRVRAAVSLDSGAFAKLGGKYGSEFNRQYLEDMLACNESVEDTSWRYKPGPAISSVTNCQVPLLAIVAWRGRTDRGVQMEHDILANLPCEDSELFVVHESGHYVQEEQAEMVSEKLVQWLGGRL